MTIATDIGVRSRANEVVRQKTSHGESISLLNQDIDANWARSARSEGNRPSSYLDYYFSGQDIFVTLTGDPSNPAKPLPIMELALQIEQEKMPIYSFWNYTYNTVLRGVRIVSGAFVIATTYPGYMNDLVATAAQIRQAQAVTGNRSYPYNKELTQDDTNIEKYWGSNLDPGYNSESKNLFSVHPPFSLTVTYGVQDISVDTSGQTTNVANFYKEYYNNQENILMTDENQRLVESNATGENRFYIDAIELKSCQRSFTSDGSICVETYAFMARDIITPNIIV